LKRTPTTIKPLELWTDQVHRDVSMLLSVALIKLMIIEKEEKEEEEEEEDQKNTNNL
jgi:transposase